MPFTPSHAVVALPFVRTPLVPAAIAIGAMSPDVPLFVRGLPLHYGRTHALEWLPATIVVALALLLVWRCLLRPAARELSPTWLAARLPGEWDAGAARGLRETFAVSGTPARASWSGLLMLLVSLVIGVVSHIVWDLFTHEGRWGVEMIPALDDQWGPLEGFKWLQHGSSVAGLVIIAVWATAWLARRHAAASVERVTPPWVRWAWWLSLPAVLIVAWLIGLGVHGPLTGSFTVAHLAYRMLPPATGVWGMITLVLAIVIQAARVRRVRAA